MQIVVLNGSPKGSLSVTMQYVAFLRDKSPQHTFTILDVCHDIRQLESEPPRFEAAMATIAEADAVLWATPVYVFLVPGPHKRFIELVFQRQATAAFAGKYAAILTTSVRFFDHAAHGYLHAVSEDLGMQVVGAYSAEMYDLLNEAERKRLLQFWQAFVAAIANRVPQPRRFAPLCDQPAALSALSPRAKVGGGKKVVVLSDAQPGGNLDTMVAAIGQCFADPVEVIKLHDTKMLCGCMGCIQCSLDNVCVFRDADEVYAAYQKIEAADIVVHAATIRDRFLSARWKTFLDRGFFNNHVPILAGKQIAFLVSGPLRQLPQVREVLEGFAQIERANLTGIVTDECSDPQQLSQLLEGLAQRLVESADARFVQPATFLGKGGHKVLRDEIWAGLRVVFHRDHQYYRSHGLYDFPRRTLGARLQEAFFRVMLLFPGFRKEFRARMRAEMVKPLEKALEELRVSGAD